MTVVRLLRLRGYPILEQLRIEEALLRVAPGAWCVLNDGAATPAIVMGISGRVIASENRKAKELVHEAAAKAAGIQVIRRFSGGGTVVVDGDSLFATLILPEGAVPGLASYPKPVMQWTRDFYRPILNRYGDFDLQEHDYAFGERKFGGNAQAITKGRWLHHTSFLWAFQPARMALLQQPAKAPAYRAGREHGAFLCQLKDFVPSRKAFLNAIPQRLADLGFEVQNAELAEARALLEREYVRSNRVVELD